MADVFIAEYRRIETDMRDRIRTGQWTLGAMLPSRRDLARQYSVSSVTMNRALQPLISDGTLRADDRRGTFISGLGMTGPGQTPPVATRVFGIVAVYEPGAFSQDALILSAMEEALSNAGHTVFVCNRTVGYEHSLLPLSEAVQVLLDRHVDAIAVICLDLDRVQLEKELGRVSFQGIPAVCILAGELHLPIPHIFYDNRIGGYLAAKHLLDKGYREITVVAPFTASWATERIHGIEDACHGAGLPDSKLHWIRGEAKPWNYQEDPVLIGRQAALATFDAGWTPHGAIICLNDQVSMGLNWAASEHDWKPGRDYAVIGFDDDPDAQGDCLTTMRPPLEGMGREAVRLLIDEMQGGSGSHQLRLRAYLIPRASTALSAEPDK
ncbi:MAG: GntR family transcriptional regulator [Janthinobacterium lividum]